MNKLEALKAGEIGEFLFKRQPKCPHCGEFYDIQSNERWDLYSDDDLHSVECPNCEGEFTVTTSCSYSFSTEDQEDEE